MRARHAAYAAIAVTTSVTAATGPRRVHAVSKLFLAPALQAGLIARRNVVARGPLLAATAGSLVGDWFMLRSGDAHRAGNGSVSRREMRWGATSFAIQQGVFVELLRRRGARLTPERVAAPGIVLAALAVLDAKHTGGGDPVLTAYGLSLGAMTALATGDRDPRVRLGGALFLVSDALIIAGEHLLRGRRAVAVRELAVMGTYSAALGLLVEGLSARRGVLPIGRARSGRHRCGIMRSRRPTTRW